MKQIYITLFLTLHLFSCKGQTDKHEEIEKKNIYEAKCKDEYSTGQKITDKEFKWSLTVNDISEIIKLSFEIDAEEVYETYPITPCYIDVSNYIMNGEKVNLSINGGSFMYIYDGRVTKVLGCDDPECDKYFLRSAFNFISLRSIKTV